VTRRGRALAMTSTCSGVGSVIQAGSCAPLKAGLMNGPSTWAPSTRAPVADAAAAAAAKAAPTSTGDEMIVGRKAVTPVAGSASDIALMASCPAAASCPPKPLTCRSTKPGAIISPGAATTSSSGRSGADPIPTQVTVPSSTRTLFESPGRPWTGPRNSVLTAQSPRRAPPPGRRRRRPGANELRPQARRSAT